MHFHSPLAKLLAWGPRRGSNPVYLYTNDFACRRAVLERDEPHDDEDDADRSSRTLTARIYGPTRLEDGRRVRGVTFVSVGDQLSRESAVTYVEAKDEDGHWHEAQSSDMGFDPIVYGALSSVDDRVARFDGAPMAIHPLCGGPVEWLACPSGGEHPCERCEAVSLMVTEPGAMFGHGFDAGKRPITCHDRCPPYPESPDIARLYDLERRVPIWRPRKAPLAVVPSLYKSRDECQRDHPRLR
jgi:hypothetical protein